MEIHAKDITAYIDYLNAHGYTVTLHGDFIHKPLFYAYNYHRNPYCHYVKTVYEQWDTCLCRRKGVMSKAENGSFFGCCYAGVGEFVYPVRYDGKVACFLSVSGYYAPLTEAKARHFAAKNGLDASVIIGLASKHLHRDLPQKEQMDAVLHPLVYMMEAYYETNRESLSADPSLYQRMLKYISDNCHSKLTMNALSRELNYSVSTLSHLFSSQSGKSLPGYLDELRLREAEWYLQNSTMPITEIAQFLGYSSSNYFATAFKKKTGQPPSAFRKQHQKS